MVAKPFTSMLVCIGSLLMTASAAQAQGLFGVPFFAPYNAQPRYASPCGPNGYPTNVNYGYAPRTNCPGGVCNQPGYGYSSNYAPRGYGMTNGACGPNGCSAGACASGSCSPRCPNGQCIPSNGGMRTMPYDYGYPSQTLPMPAAPQRDEISNRPSYYYDELPDRAAPPAYRDPRDGFYPGASRDNRYDISTVDRSRSRFETDRSPFYP